MSSFCQLHNQTQNSVYITHTKQMLHTEIINCLLHTWQCSDSVTDVRLQRQQSSVPKHSSFPCRQHFKASRDPKWNSIMLPPNVLHFSQILKQHRMHLLQRWRSKIAMPKTRNTRWQTREMLIINKHISFNRQCSWVLCEAKCAAAWNAINHSFVRHQSSQHAALECSCLCRNSSRHWSFGTQPIFSPEVEHCWNTWLRRPHLETNTKLFNRKMHQ